MPYLNIVDVLVRKSEHITFTFYDFMEIVCYQKKFRRNFLGLIVYLQILLIDRVYEDRIACYR